MEAAPGVRRPSVSLAPNAQRRKTGQGLPLGRKGQGPPVPFVARPKLANDNGRGGARGNLSHIPRNAVLLAPTQHHQLRERRPRLRTFPAYLTKMAPSEGARSRWTARVGAAAAGSAGSSRCPELLLGGGGDGGGASPAACPAGAGWPAGTGTGTGTAARSGCSEPTRSDRAAIRGRGGAAAAWVVAAASPSVRPPTGRRHTGHEPWCASHSRMQSIWNKCPHESFLAALMRSRQMAQSSSYCARSLLVASENLRAMCMRPVPPPPTPPPRSQGQLG